MVLESYFSAIFLELTTVVLLELSVKIKVVISIKLIFINHSLWRVEEEEYQDICVTIFVVDSVHVDSTLIVVLFHLVLRKLVFFLTLICTLQKWQISH